FRDPFANRRRNHSGRARVPHSSRRGSAGAASPSRREESHRWRRAQRGEPPRHRLQRSVLLHLPRRLLREPNLRDEEKGDLNTVPTLVLVSAFLLATVASTLLIPVVRVIAFRVGAVSTPGGRHIHSRAIPRLGGVAIASGFCIALGLLVWHDPQTSH